MEPSLSRQLVARIGAVLLVVFSVMTIVGLLLPHEPSVNAAGVIATGAVAILIGSSCWFLPWARWRPAASLAAAVAALALIAVHGYFAVDWDLFALYFVVAFTWLGIGHPRGAAVRFIPVLLAAYLAPVLLRPHSPSVVSAAVFVAMACAIVGETLAGVTAQLGTARRVLHENESRMQHIVKASPDLICTLDAHGCYTYANAAHQQVLGHDPQALLQRSLLNDVHPDDLSDLQQCIYGRITRGSPGGPARRLVRFRLRHADGRWIALEARPEALFDDVGEAAGLLVISRDIAERVELEDQLQHQAYHDHLTGLPNRALFMDRLERALSATERPEPRVAVLFLDLDRFKVINDSLGHATGDALLVAVAERLAACMRPGDTVARFGGDEFIVVLEGAGAERAERVASRIVNTVRQPFQVNTHTIFTGVSVGVTVGEPGAAADDLVREADIALCEAKLRGRSTAIMFDTEMKTRTTERLALETDLRSAAASGELLVCYQPEVDIVTGQVVGMEALVRWQHPLRGLISPLDFIPMAEETGLILGIGPFVLEEACRQMQRWRQLPGGKQLVMSVNLSAREFGCADVVDVIAGIIARTGIEPSSLRLEITESAVMRDVELTERILQRLKALGVWLAIDDFGTGYSSLSYLRRFPVDTVKIDQSFVAALGTDRGAASIVRAVTALSHALGLDVTAEGIETEDQLRMLDELNCDRGQGFLFSRPMPAEAMEAFLLASHDDALNLQAG